MGSNPRALLLIDKSFDVGMLACAGLLVSHHRNTGFLFTGTAVSNRPDTGVTEPGIFTCKEPHAEEMIAYADKGNARLRRKYYKMIRHGKKKNVAVTAVARVWDCIHSFPFPFCGELFHLIDKCADIFF